MRKLLIAAIFSCLVFTSSGHAALSANTVWEIRGAGSVNNSGCYVSGSSGTDYSQQDSAHESYTDLVIGGTTTDLTSAAHPFASDDVGNCIQIISGSGCTAGFFYVVSVSVVTATMDRSVGTAASTCSGTLGGALDHPLRLTGGTTVAGNKVYIKAATYTHTSTILAITSVGTAAAPIRWIGYQTSRDDDTGTHPVLTSATNSVNLVTLNAANFNFFENIKFTHTATTRGDAIRGVTAQSSGIVIKNCVFDGLAIAINGTAQQFIELLVIDSLIENTTSNGITGGGATTGRLFLLGNVLYNVGNGSGTVTGILYTNGPGASLYMQGNVVSHSSGIGLSIGSVNAANAQSFTLIGNAFDTNGSDGFKILNTTGLVRGLMLNNIFWDNGGYGVNVSAASGWNPDVTIISRTNAYGSNSPSDLNGISAGAGDVTITGDPWISSGAGLDWDLDNTASEGAALRAAGFPGVLGGTGNTSTTGKLDIGVSQHADPASSGGGSFTFVGP